MNFDCPCKGSFTSVNPEGAACILPPWDSKREQEGLNPLIAIDFCVIPEIKILWNAGVKTGSVCCGHGFKTGIVNVIDDDDEKLMSELGYHKAHEMVGGPRGYLLKTTPKIVQDLLMDRAINAVSRLETELKEGRV